MSASFCLAGAMDALEGKEDRFGGVTVTLDPAKHARWEPAVFGVRLVAALESWAGQGKRGIWLRVPSQVASLIDPAIMLGFEFHHAQPGYVMLTKWLPATPSSLPVYPHHQVGVGGLVLDGSGKRVLCIQERSGLTAGMLDFWKLPGGLVDPGEDLCDAAVREVREETGIQTVFECVATVRESQSGGPFGCTDLYAVCVLRLSEEAHGPQSAGSTPPAPSPQESEIAAAEWRDVEELLSSKYYAKGLYGSLLRTACDVALRRGGLPRLGAAADAAAAGPDERLGLARVQMKGLAGRPESMYFAGEQPLAKAASKL